MSALCLSFTPHLSFWKNSRCSSAEMLLSASIQATIHLDSRRFTSLSKAFFSLSRHKGDRLQLFLHICMSLTGVNIWTLSLKLPMKIMMDMRWLSLSMRLNCIMKRSSSLRASRGFLSLSYCRRSFISASVGKNRIKHSTKSTRIVRRSKLQKRKSHEHC